MNNQNRQTMDDGRPTTGHRQLKNGHKIITRLNFQTKREAKNYDETWNAGRIGRFIITAYKNRFLEKKEELMVGISEINIKSGTETVYIYMHVYKCISMENFQLVLWRYFVFYIIWNTRSTHSGNKWWSHERLHQMC